MSKFPPKKSYSLRANPMKKFWCRHNLCKLDHFSAMGTMVCTNKTVWLTKRVSKFTPKKFYIICLRANPIFWE